MAGLLRNFRRHDVRALRRGIEPAALRGERPRGGDPGHPGQPGRDVHESRAGRNDRYGGQAFDEHRGMRAFGANAGAALLRSAHFAVPDLVERFDIEPSSDFSAK